MTSFEKNGLLYLQLFVVFPIVKKDTSSLPVFFAEDTLMMFENEDFSYRGMPFNAYKPHVFVWECLVFEKNISMELSTADQELLKNAFIWNADNEFYQKIKLKSIEYFERIESGYQYDNCLKALNVTNKRRPIIFIPKYEPF